MRVRRWPLTGGQWARDGASSLSSNLVNLGAVLRAARMVKTEAAWKAVDNLSPLSSFQTAVQYIDT